MNRFKIASTIALALAGWLSSCGSDYSADDFRQASRAYEQTSSSDLELCGTQDCGRLSILVTADNPASRFAVSANGTLTVTSDTVARLGLTDNVVVLTDQTNLPSSGKNRDVTMALYSGMGEWLRLDAAETLATRAAQYLGYAGATPTAQLTAMLNDLTANSGQPRYTIQNPTGDVFVDTLASYPEFAFGTAADGHRVVSGTCATCHVYRGAKVQNNGSTRIVWEPLDFNANVRAPNAARFSVATLMSALAAGLKAGPQAGDSAYLQALYVLGNQGYADANSAKCLTWHCDQTSLQNAENIASPLYLLRRAYVWALAVDANAASIGAGFNSSYISGGMADATVATLSQPFSRSDFDVGGKRVGITNAVFANQALTAIPELPLRSPYTALVDSNYYYGDYQPDYSLNFSIPWVSGGTAATAYIQPQIEGYLFGATYLRAPGIDDITAAMPAGWATATLISSLPRYSLVNQYGSAAAFFQFQDLAMLPAAALCTMTNANVYAASAAYNRTCGQCHAAPTTVDQQSDGVLFRAVDAPYAPSVIAGAGVTYAQSVEAAIVTANGSAAVPSIMSSVAPNPETLTPSAVSSASASRVGPYRDPGMVFAGWPSALDFLNAGGGQATAQWIVPPGSRACVSQEPVATAPYDQADHDRLASLYRLPEMTGQVPHPPVPALAGLSAAQKQLLANFLVGPWADGAYVDETGLVHLYLPSQPVDVATLSCSALTSQSACENSQDPVCAWNGAACYGFNAPSGSIGSPGTGTAAGTGTGSGTGH